MPEMCKQCGFERLDANEVLRVAAEGLRASLAKVNAAKWGTDAHAEARAHMVGVAEVAVEAQEDHAAGLCAFCGWKARRARSAA